MRLMLACFVALAAVSASGETQPGKESLVRSAKPTPPDSWFARWGGRSLRGVAMESCTPVGKGDNERQMALRTPHRHAPGRPWVLIAAFPGHLERLEGDLLVAGWSLAYVQCPNEFGSDRAMQAWEALYDDLTRGEKPLSPKPVVLGISRGGLYALAWARRHPDRLSALYLDNGVCDARSWPGGKPLGFGKGQGSPDDWRRLRRHLGFADDAAAIAGLPRPTDGLEAARDAGVLLISVHGTADTIVPYEENAAKVVAFWQAGGKQPLLFPKEGGDHHPHGLPDMKPVFEALQKAAR